MSFITDHKTVLISLSEWAIKSSIESLKADDQLTLGLREALRNGVAIEDLAEALMLSVQEIERLASKRLNILEDRQLAVC